MNGLKKPARCSGPAKSPPWKKASGTSRERKTRPTASNARPDKARPVLKDSHRFPRSSGAAVPEPQPAAALRACAAGLYHAEAACELLIATSWPHRADFRDGFIHAAVSISDGATAMASIDWAAAITALAGGQLPCSGAERRLLRQPWRRHTSRPPGRPGQPRRRQPRPGDHGRPSRRRPATRNPESRLAVPAPEDHPGSAEKGLCQPGAGGVPGRARDRVRGHRRGAVPAGPL